MPRRKQSIVEDLIDITAHFPWWVGVALAVAFYVGLHQVAIMEVAMPADGKGMGHFVGKQMYKTFAMYLQYILPALFMIGAAVSAFKRLSRRALHGEVAAAGVKSALERMSWKQFEQLVGEHFRRRGFAVQENDTGGADGGVDLALTRGADRYLVQCKQWRARQVLPNRLGITRVRDIQLAESQALRLAQREAINAFSDDHIFTLSDICQLHRMWLGPIYDWAGEFRVVNVGKCGFQFASARLIPELMAAFGREVLRRYTPCRPGSDAKIAQALAVVHGEFVLIHPFREGNGRLARLLALLMGLQAGLPPLFFTARRARKTPLHRRHTRRGWQRLRFTDGDVSAGYRPDAEDCFFQYLISASVDDRSKASRPLEKGARIPSIAEEVFAEIQSSASAFAGDRRNRFDFVSFIGRILRLLAWIPAFAGMTTCGISGRCSRRRSRGCGPA